MLRVKRTLRKLGTEAVGAATTSGAEVEDSRKKFGRGSFAELRFRLSERVWLQPTVCWGTEAWGWRGCQKNSLELSHPLQCQWDLLGRCVLKHYQELLGDLSGNPFHEVSLGVPLTNGPICCRKKKNITKKRNIFPLQHPSSILCWKV